jgi:hypothetical protein
VQLQSLLKLTICAVKRRGRAPDPVYRQIAIVNVTFFRVTAARDGGWLLIDTGAPAGLWNRC